MNWLICTEKYLQMKKLRYNKSILNESANYTNIIDQDEGVLPEWKFR